MTIVEAGDCVTSGFADSGDMLQDSRMADETRMAWIKRTLST